MALAVPASKELNHQVQLVPDFLTKGRSIK